MSTRPHVGFFVDRFDVGGSELNAAKVAEALMRAGVRLTVFHLSETGALRDRYVQAGAELVHVPVRGLLSASAWGAIRLVKRICDQRGIDLLHSHCVYTNILGAGVATLPGRAMPFLASRRWTGSLPKPSLGVLNRWAQSVASGVLVNSPSLVDVVRRESTFSRPVYVPNMLRDESFIRLTTEERSARRTRLGIPSTGPVVGCVARLAPVKDHQTLLAAWRRVIVEIPAATLVIIGDGPMDTALKSIAAEPAFHRSVHFTGELSPDTVPHALLDVTALASLDEGFPNSLLEAMAQGVVVVATRVGGVPDLVENGRNGLLVEAANPESLAKALLAVLMAQVDGEAIRAAGRTTAEDHREHRVIAQLQTFYDHLRTPGRR